ncbi:MAG: hypothetical protein B7X00_02125 [Legionella sp. 21-45-4]|nr:MAG: hypothetical protein B7X00_02125 [Legionella sp. 21-45-4]
MQVKKRLLHHRQAYLSSMQLLVRTPVATLMTILVIAVTLIWPLIFFALKHGLESQLPSWSDGQQIQVYLKMPLSEAAQQAAFLRIQNIEGVQLSLHRHRNNGVLWACNYSR